MAGLITITALPASKGPMGSPAFLSARAACKGGGNLSTLAPSPVSPPLSRPGPLEYLRAASAKLKPPSISAIIFLASFKEACLFCGLSGIIINRTARVSGGPVLMPISLGSGPSPLRNFTTSASVTTTLLTTWEPMMRLRKSSMRKFSRKPSMVVPLWAKEASN